MPVTPPKPDAPRLNETAARHAAASPAISVSRRHVQISQKSGILTNSSEQETFIQNPIMVGSAIDYKATSIKLADQLWQAWDQLNSMTQEARNYRRDSHSLHDRLSDLHNKFTKALIVHDHIREHWSFFLLPKSIKTYLLSIQD